MFNQIKHAIKIALLTFVISLVISFLFGYSLALWIGVIILISVILAGIIFDIVGTAVTAAKEAPFHAMAADKVRGSKEAIYLIRHADQVANFCNDVIGDIAGTMSGAIIAGIILRIAQGSLERFQDLLSAFGIALIAALTVGGKAFGKWFAIGHANNIISNVGKLLSLFKLINLDLKQRKRKSRPGPRKVKKKHG